MPVLKKWLHRKHEVEFLFLAELLHMTTMGTVDVRVLMSVLESLPHTKAYGYHIVRGFTNVCFALRAGGFDRGCNLQNGHFGGAFLAAGWKMRCGGNEQARENDAFVNFCELGWRMGGCSV